MKTEIRRLFALSGEEKVALVQAWMGLLLADFALKSAPLPLVQRFLAALFRSFRLPETSLSPQRLAQLVDAVARRHVRRMRCLPRSLVLQALLYHHGWRAELRIGVRRQAASLQAHAWLEIEGEPIAEPRETTSLFAPLLPSETA